MKRRMREIMRKTPLDSLTKQEISDLRDNIEFSLQVAYGGKAILSIQSPNPSDWKMTVPIFSTSVMLMREALEERSLHATH
jgi:hypothetical protein